MAKRRNGEGSLSRRSDRRWQGSLVVGYQPNGRPSRKFVYGKTAQEATARLLALRSNAAAGLPIVDGRATVAQFLARWLEVVRPTVRSSTYLSYEAVVRVHLVPGVGRVRIARLDVPTLQQFLGRKLADGCSRQRVAYLRVVLRRALGMAERWGVIARNPARLVESPRVERRSVAALSPGDLEYVLFVNSGSEANEVSLKAATRGMDCVVHCVQFPNHPVENPRKGHTYINIDGMGTARLVWTCVDNGVKRFVYLSGAGTSPLIV